MRFLEPHILSVVSWEMIRDRQRECEVLRTSFSVAFCWGQYTTGREREVLRTSRSLPVSY